MSEVLSLVEKIKHVGPAHFGLQAPPSSFLPLKVPEARPGNEKDCVTGGAGGSTLGHTGDTHHEGGEPCRVRAHTVLPSVTDSQDGRDLTVLPCSLSCSHISQMPEDLTHLPQVVILPVSPETSP